MPKNLDSDWLKKSYKDGLSNSDCIHMVIAHECVELIYDINRRPIEHTDIPVEGEFIASDIGVELFLHHAFKHKEMHKVPRYYANLSDINTLVQLFFEAAHKEHPEYKKRLEAIRMWMERIRESITRTIKELKDKMNPNVLRSCPLLHSGLKCPGDQTIECPQGFTLEDKCPKRT